MVCARTLACTPTGGCPPNTVTQMDATGNYLNCNPFSPVSGCLPVWRFACDRAMTCFQTYSCQYVQINSRYQCCGQAPILAVCGNGGTPQMSNNIPIPCSLSNPFVCAAPTYSCLPTTTGSFACCTQTGGGGEFGLLPNVHNKCVQVSVPRARSSPTASV